MQSVSNVEATSATFPTLLLGLRGQQEQNKAINDVHVKASAGLQAAGQAIGDQATVARDALNERMVIAQAGTKLWRDGAATALLAKKAAIDSASLDVELLSRAQAVSAAFQESALEMRDAQLNSDEALPIRLGFTAVALANLTVEQEERAKAYGEALEKLREPAAVPELSAPEWDAVRLAQLHSGFQDATMVAAEKTKVATEQFSRGVAATASNLSASTSERRVFEQATDVDLHEQMLRMWAYFEQAMGGQATAAKVALNERADTIRTGTKLWHDGATRLVLAKKAAFDTAKLDAEFILSAQAAGAAFRQSAAALRAAQSELELAGATDSLAALAEEHEERAKIYCEVLSVLRQPAVAPELTAPEWDAMRLAQALRGCQEVTRAAAETVPVAADHVSWGFNVAGRHVREVCC
jgi:hypothetical protein